MLSQVLVQNRAAIATPRLPEEVRRSRSVTVTFELGTDLDDVLQAESPYKRLRAKRGGPQKTALSLWSCRSQFRWLPHPQLTPACGIGKGGGSQRQPPRPPSRTSYLGTALSR